MPGRAPSRRSRRPGFGRRGGSGRRLTRRRDRCRGGQWLRAAGAGDRAVAPAIGVHEGRQDWRTGRSAGPNAPRYGSRAGNRVVPDRWRARPTIAGGPTSVPSRRIARGPDPGHVPRNRRTERPRDASSRRHGVAAGCRGKRRYSACGGGSRAPDGGAVARRSKSARPARCVRCTATLGLARPRVAGQRTHDPPAARTETAGASRAWLCTLPCLSAQDGREARFGAQ
jgi:hypothetical protein